MTANLRDFPAADLADRAAVYAAVQQIADSLRNPPGSVDDVLDRLERNGLAVTVAELRAGR